LKRVLFVCTGNTCRSPLAEVLFRELTKERGDYEVCSAGVGAISGHPASRHSQELARQRGLDLSGHRSQAVTIDLVDDATHIFAMSRGHLADLLDRYPDAEDKMYLVSEFAADDELRGRDLSDPFGGGLEDYRTTLSHLERLLPCVYRYIEQTWKPPAGDA
jgi:protein-tyrosine-phosphatase